MLFCSGQRNPLLTKDAVVGHVLLVGCQIWDDAERQLKLICPSNYHPLLLIPVGTDDIAVGDLEYINYCYRVLWAKMGVQMMLSLILKAKAQVGVDNSCK